VLHLQSNHHHHCGLAPFRSDFGPALADLAGIFNELETECTELVPPKIDVDDDGYFVNEAPNDCDDFDASINPATTEIKNDGIDQDCDGVDFVSDADGDGYSIDAEPFDCNDNNATIYPGALEWINPDGIDSNCDGYDIAAVTDYDKDGYYLDAEPFDCNDIDATINPGAFDIPDDGIDQDCNGVDYIDADIDLYTADIDCNDNDATINPGATEIPDDGIDQDCDGTDLIEQTDTMPTFTTDKQIYEKGARVTYSGQIPDARNSDIKVKIIDNRGDDDGFGSAEVNSDGTFSDSDRLDTGRKWSGDLQLQTTVDGNVYTASFCVNDPGRGVYCDSSDVDSTTTIKSSDSALITDKQIYEKGDRVTYSGLIPDARNSDIKVEIIDNRGGIDSFGRAEVNSDGTFSDSDRLDTGGRWNGDLELQVTVNGNVYTASFCVNDPDRGVKCQSSDKVRSFAGTLESAQTFDIMSSDGTTSTYGKQGYTYGFKAIGNTVSEINSDKICGLSLCSESMSTAEIIQQYLQSKGLD